MLRRHNRLARLALLVVFTVAGFAAPAEAAGKAPTADKVPPYDVTGMPHSRVWVPWIFAFVFMAGAIAVGVKNPRRAVGGSS